MSIYQLARLNNHERLLVDPVTWTSRHVELLQFFFDAFTKLPSTEADCDMKNPTGHAREAQRLFERAYGTWQIYDMNVILASRHSPLSASLVTLSPCA